MDAVGGDSWDQVSASLARTGHASRSRELLERAEARFQSSAARLRAAGRADHARRAEEFAESLHFNLRDLRAARLLWDALPASHVNPALGRVLDDILDITLELLHADRGNVQLADPASGALRIAAQRGFDPEFLKYFAVVTDDGSACGRAARQCAQVVIADVTTDPGYAPHREIALASGFRAVQSTPLVDEAGRLVGMLSTHYPRPTSLPGRDLKIIGRFGALVAGRLSTLLDGGPVRDRVAQARREA
jgi:hypothetical protein